MKMTYIAPLATVFAVSTDACILNTLSVVQSTGNPQDDDTIDSEDEIEVNVSSLWDEE